MLSADTVEEKGQRDMYRKTDFAIHVRKVM